MRSKLITGLLFVFCGISGVFMFLVSSVLIGMRILDPQINAPRWSGLLVANVIGIFLTLVGVGKLSHPAYSLVFLSIPFSGWLYARINPSALGGIIGFIAFVGVTSYLTFYAVRRYYARLDQPTQGS